jgi:hypothetical protein
MPKGGSRPNSGRKPIDPSGEKRKRVYFFLTEAEQKAVREFIEQLRAKKS